MRVFPAMALNVKDDGADRLVRELAAETGEGLNPSRTSAQRAHPLRQGRSPAGLNYGDCFACALAQTLGRPLLFEGEGLAQTDVVPAVAAT